MNGKKSAARRGLTTLTPAVLSLALVTVVGCKGAPSEQGGDDAAGDVVGPENIAVVKGEQIAFRSGDLRHAAARGAGKRSRRGRRHRPEDARRGGSARFARPDLGAHRRRDASGSVLSAQAAATTAQNTVDLDKRQVDRNAALLKAGAIAERDLEMSQNQLSAAQAQLANASRCSPTPTSS